MRPKTLNPDPNVFTILRCAGEKPEQWIVHSKTPIMTANPKRIPAESVSVLRSQLPPRQ